MEYQIKIDTDAEEEAALAAELAVRGQTSEEFFLETLRTRLIDLIDTHRQIDVVKVSAALSEASADTRSQIKIILKLT
jgi:hypothetical protein